LIPAESRVEHIRANLIKKMLWQEVKNISKEKRDSEHGCITQ